MARTRSDALEQVRKLLALGESENPNEAAAAVARAQALMEAHDIAEADVVCRIDEEVVELPFGIPGSHRDGQLGKKSSWQGELARVVAEAFGCATIWRIGSLIDPSIGRFKKHANLVLAGRKQDVDLAIQVKDFCHREIDRLTAQHGSGLGRSWGISFRIGCVDAIRAAIEEEREKTREVMRDVVSERALVLYDDRVARAMESFGPDVKASRGHSNMDLEAWSMGRVAGRHVWTGAKPRIEA